MKKKRKGILSVLLVGILLTGCCLGPEHCVPNLELSENWDAETSSKRDAAIFSHSEPLELGDLFDDQLLREYLELLIIANHDIQIASAKVCEAFALRQISAAKLFPIVDGRIAYNTSKPAGGILESSATTNQGGGALAGIPLNIKQQNFIADFDAIWELDLFGKRQREVESATAFVQMEEASYYSVLVSLTAEFARVYLELRRSQSVLDLVQRQIQLLNEKRQVTQDRLAQGLDSELLFLDSQASLDQLLAEAPFYEGEIRSLMYRLSVLLGKTPESLTAELNQRREVPTIKETIPVGFPADLLRRRPDIHVAERELAKATADVGVAVADLFPKITLFGNYGYQNLHLGRSKGDGESWGFGGDLLSPIFHGGSLRANVRRNRWIRHEAFLSYEQAVLRALEESESSIAKFQTSQQTLRHKRDVYLRELQLLSHTQGLYDDGLVNRQQLLDSELDCIRAKREWVNANVDSEIQLITLYKAIGGAWSC